MRRSFEGEAYIHQEVYLKAEELALAQATAISVVSKEIKATLVSRGVSEDKVLVNPNGVDLEAYRPPAPAERVSVRRGLGFLPTHPLIRLSGKFRGWHGGGRLSPAIPDTFP